jgi:hypothetical protein
MEDSIKCCSETGARPYLAVGYFRYAELMRKKGDLGQARTNLSQATMLFTEMEMAGWLELAGKLGKMLRAN